MAVMNKFKTMRKKAAIEFGIALGVIAVFSGAYMGVSSMVASAEETKNQLQSRISQLQSETASARERLESADSSAALYAKIASSRSRDVALPITRDELTNVLSAMKDIHRLSKLNMELAPFEAFTNEDLTAMEVKASKAAVKLTFGGMSDQHLYSFIERLNRDLAGFAKLTKLSLTRSLAFDIDTMRQVSRGAQPEMVTGDVEFEWYGFNRDDAPEPDAATPDPAAGVIE